MEVGLYIYTESLENTSNVTANDFRTRVLNNSGNFEALQCCIDNIENLGGTSAIVPTAKRIDLFDDETIQVTSTIQNINDIGKVFTDYSQSFNVPASKNNNEIFRHWYENANDNGFNQNVRYDGYIEIDTQIFRIGRWQIESAEIKDGQVNNYKLTFYGLLRSLVDKFGEDKLVDLTDINQFNFEWNATNVRSRIQNEGNVVFPLISSNRVWQYGGGGNLDISQNSHPIDISELFPSIRVARLFDAIEAKYGINLNGTFLNDPRFTKLYLWLKNREVINVLSSIEDVDITSVTNPNNRRWTANATTNAIANNGFTNNINTGITQFLKLFVTVTVSNPTTQWTLFTYRNGVLFSETTQTGNVTDLLLIEQLSINQNSQFVGNYTFKIQTSVPDTVTLLFEGETKPIGGSVITTIANATATTTADLTLSALAPDMKVSDFFSGILKMFNLTCFSFDEVNYQVEQLENWYRLGEIKDITKYVTTDLNLERFKTYKEINFKYQKSESFINRKFFDLFRREHGDLDEKFSNDGGEYKIELPFEKLQYNKLSGNLHVAYSLTNPPDFKPYLPKPVLFYAFGNVSCPTFYVSGSTAIALTDYCLTGDFINFANQPQTINWGTEQILGTNNFALAAIATNSLFFNYYSNYLTNLYSLKSRIVKCKARFDFPFLNALKLNDRVVIRDKRYTINQMTTNLTTSEVDLELIQDFREVLPAINQTVVLPALGEVQVPVIDPDEVFTIIDDPEDIIRVTDPTSAIPWVDVEVGTPGTTPYEGTIEGNNGSLIYVIIP